MIILFSVIIKKEPLGEPYFKYLFIIKAPNATTIKNIYKNDLCTAVVILT